MTDEEIFDVDVATEGQDAVPEGRMSFNTRVASKLAQGAVRGAMPSGQSGFSARFAYFATDSDLVVVAGPQEKQNADLALAYGLTYCGDRKLALVLPEPYAFPTLQRVPFLKTDLRPKVFTFGTGKEPVPERASTNRKDVGVALAEKAGADPAVDLRKSSAPLHLGERGSWVAELVAWASQNHDLDPAHRPNVRSWQCRGQRVLTITRSAGKSVSIIAGIHYSKPGERPEPVVLKSSGQLTDTMMVKIKKLVQEAVELRLKPKMKFHKPDEHWLQSVLRRDPELVGVEQPALREVPAWRPKGGAAASPHRAWGRGFVDLVGLDAHGDLRVVETKLAANKDEMFILQGLDYFVWSQTYGDALRARLGAAHKAESVVHYVVGTDPSTGTAALSSFAAAQAAALDIPWRAQVVDKWFIRPAPPAGAVTVVQLAENELPS